MLGIAVIAREFLAGLYRAPGIELHPVIGDPDVRIWFAGMIDIAKRACSLAARVNGPIVHLHNGNSFPAFGAAPGFAEGDPFTGEFANFLAGRNGCVSKQADAIDGAFSPAKHGKDYRPKSPQLHGGPEGVLFPPWSRSKTRLRRMKAVM